MAKNISGLKPFKAGEDSRRNLEGRPRKYVSLLKEQGYKLNEINDSIQALMSMTPKELEAVTKNPEATVLEMTVAPALMIPNGLLTPLPVKNAASSSNAIANAALVSVLPSIINWLNPNYERYGIIK